MKPLSALIFHKNKINKEMKTMKLKGKTHRRVKVGFVFELNSLIFNDCAYNTVISYTYFLSDEQKEKKN